MLLAHIPARPDYLLEKQPQPIQVYRREIWILPRFEREKCQASCFSCEVLLLGKLTQKGHHSRGNVALDPRNRPRGEAE